MRWLAVTALAVLALGLLALALDRPPEGEGPAAAASGPGAEAEPASGGVVQRAEIGSRPRPDRAEPWPGLTGDWMYRCPVEVRFAGAPAGESVLVSGPGLPAAGWRGSTAEGGAFAAPELAIGENYSFTLGGGWFVVPMMGYEVLGPGSLAVEAYAPPGPGGAHRTMRVAGLVVRGTERVRLLDGRDGRLLSGARARAVQGDGAPVPLADGNAEWLAADGTIPLPLPTRSYDQDPDLVVHAADGTAYEPLPLGPPNLVLALERGALSLTPIQELPLVRLQVFRSDGQPATDARIVASGRELAQADRQGLAAFTATGPAFTVSAPGHVDAQLATAEWGTKDPGAEPRPLFLEPRASWKLRVECPDPRALTLVVHADSRLRIKGATEGIASSAAGESIHVLRNLYPFPQSQLDFEAPMACEVRVRCTLWQATVDDFVLHLTPGRPESSTWRAPEAAGEGMKFRIVDAAGAAVPEARVWIGLRDQDAAGEDPLHEAIALDRRGRAAWSLPWWPDRIVPALRVSAAGLMDRVLTVRELQDAGGTVVLQPMRAFRVEVLDETGAAVPGARLSLAAPDHLGLGVRQQPLDGMRPSRAAEIRGLEVRDAGGIVDLQVAAPGFRTAELRHDPAEGDLSVILRHETRP